jgi:hypothetical protein
MQARVTAATATLPIAPATLRLANPGDMKTLRRQQCIGIPLGTVSAATKGFSGDVLLDTEEKIRLGAQVRYTGCCI